MRHILFSQWPFISFDVYCLCDPGHLIFRLKPRHTEKTAMYLYTIKTFHTVYVQELLEWLLSACFCCFSTEMTERCRLIKSNCSAERDGAALAWVEKYLRSVIRLLSVLPRLLLRECLNWLFTRLRRIWRGSTRSSTMKRRIIVSLTLQTTYFQDWSGYYAG